MLSVGKKNSLHARVLWAFAILAALLVIEAAAILFIWGRIDEHAYQLELAQESRLMAQQTAVDLRSFLYGQKNLLGQITAAADDESRLLTTLKTGGLWNGRTVARPNDIQKLSLEKTVASWDEFRGSVIQLTTHEVWKDSTLAANASADSLAGPAPVLKVMDSKVARARTFLDGQWLRVSNLLKEFEADSKLELNNQRSVLTQVIIGVILLDILLLAYYYFVFRKSFLLRLQHLQSVAENRAVWNSSADDEIDRIGEEVNTITSQIQQASDFVVKIGEGKLDEKLTADETNSKLAQALEGMQSKLKSINEEDQKRRWANEGLTKFVDILRSGNDNLHVLGDRIISTLVQYTQSNQGGLYLAEGEDNQKYLELISLFAFNSKKFEQQRLKAGEGLVGQCYLEAQTIFLTEIPEDYIRITSGLGGANPKSILIVPLKIDREIYGIVELASFQVYQPHEIAFVEKLGEAIASTLSSVKGNQKTRKLLEDFQQQAEQMRAQEEEMRQNMEELTATQEEMTRKEQDYILRIKELESQKAQTVPGDDWAVATEMEKTLRIQLEALSIAQKQAGTGV